MPDLNRSTGAMARLIFAGTGGGAHPDRAHECIVVQATRGDVLLLDTGGGFEVVRNLKQAGVDLGAIHSIFLSHRHSDHIGGLEPLLLHVGLHALSARSTPATPTAGPGHELAVYGHPAVIKAGQTMLAAMTSNAPHLFKMVGARLRWESLLPRRRMPLGPGLHLTPFTVDHEPPGDTCLGCRVDLDYDGTAWRIVYSGDTRPTPELDRYAQGADVLIHEAGGVDANANQVHATGHSTAGEAARLATKAGVKRLFLTHLPHEQVLSEVLEEARCHYSGPVSVPYDLDALDFSDLLGVLPDTP